MKVLLLCGYRNTDENEPALGLERDAEGETLMDRQISTLQTLGFTVVAVLSGLKADEQLRESRRLPDIEMVFDQAPQPTLVSNAREGALSLLIEACFVLPVEIPAAPAVIWHELRHEYARIGFQTDEAILQSGGAPWHFPLLFTRQGTENLQSTSDLHSFVDARLKYLRLAPEEKSL